MSLNCDPDVVFLKLFCHYATSAMFPRDSFTKMEGCLCTACQRVDGDQYNQKQTRDKVVSGVDPKERFEVPTMLFNLIQFMNQHTLQLVAPVRVPEIKCYVMFDFKYFRH